MRTFSIELAQIERLTASLISEELSWRYGIHVDEQKSCAWVADTNLQGDAIGLSEAQLETCLTRIATFFGQQPDQFNKKKVDLETLGNLSEAVQSLISRQLKSFSFFSAGSTTIDEGHVHSAASVYSDARSIANLIYGRRRIVSLVKPHSYIGFAATILVANLQRIQSVDARAFTLDALSSAFAFGDAVVATPTQWRYLLDQGVAAPDNAMAVLFGEQMSNQLAIDLRKAGFGAHRELYGSTEDGLIGWRDSTNRSFSLFDNWVHNDSGLLRAAPSGEIVKKTPMDLLEFDDAGGFRLCGRRDGAVQVGAINVFPELIAAAIEKHPAVHKCAIRVTRSSDGADRVVAEINLSAKNLPTESVARDIDAWCKAELRPFERPRIYNFVSSVSQANTTKSPA